MEQSSHFFEFEDEFISDLRCIPLCVRRKLDLIGLKLKLQHWQEFNHDDKRKIVYWSDSIDDLDALKSYLISKSSRSRIGQAKEILISKDEPWLLSGTVPDFIEVEASKYTFQISQRIWSNLSELERFALCKLARPGHEHRNLIKAFKEILIHNDS